jgi:hypothetical protein
MRNNLVLTVAVLLPCIAGHSLLQAPAVESTALPTPKQQLMRSGAQKLVGKGRKACPVGLKLTSTNVNTKQDNFYCESRRMVHALAPPIGRVLCRSAASTPGARRSGHQPTTSKFSGILSPHPTPLPLPPLTPPTPPPPATAPPTATVVRRFGPKSRQAKAFVPAEALAAAQSRADAAAATDAAAAPTARSAAAAPLAAAPVDEAELDALTALFETFAAAANATAAAPADAAAGHRHHHHHRRRLLATTTIPVYVNAITAADGTGRVSDAAIAAQMDAMNSAYAPWGFQFTLQSINRIAKNSWFGFDIDTQSGWDAQTAMKAQNRKGGATALNMYITEIAAGILGEQLPPPCVPSPPARLARHAARLRTLCAAQHLAHPPPQTTDPRSPPQATPPSPMSTSTGPLTTVW